MCCQQEQLLQTQAFLLNEEQSNFPFKTKNKTISSYKLSSPTLFFGSKWPFTCLGVIKRWNHILQISGYSCFPRSRCHRRERRKKKKQQNKIKNEEERRQHTTATTSNCTIISDHFSGIVRNFSGFSAHFKPRSISLIQGCSTQDKLQPSHIIIVILKPIEQTTFCGFSFPVGDHYLYHCSFLF